MNRHINKDKGDQDKIHLSSFLKIRKKSMIQFLNEREISSIEQFDNCLLELNNYFHISNELINEAKDYFQNPQQSEPSSDIYEINEVNPEQTEPTPKVTKTKSKKFNIQNT